MEFLKKTVVKSIKNRIKVLFEYENSSSFSDLLSFFIYN